MLNIPESSELDINKKNMPQISNQVIFNDAESKGLNCRTEVHNFLKEIEKIEQNYSKHEGVFKFLKGINVVEKLSNSIRKNTCYYVLSGHATLSNKFPRKRRHPSESFTETHAL